MKNIKIKFVVAMEEEATQLKRLFPEEEILITGVGVSNVIRNFSRLHNKSTIYINVGYAGSNSKEHKIGDAVLIGRVRPEKVSNVISETVREIYSIGANNSNVCYTSDDFVTNSEHTGIFDMELFYLGLFKLKGLYSVKIISDNLNYNAFEKFNSEEAWNKAGELIKILLKALRK